ncbi:pseudouridine-5'-phosphate glycosidase [Legionella jordanis]|uniref:Pseudouridine-5'-phosphate glycosidase n=1 Tax=Legionella jordanis TaxID=456 RepID=A0A0W0VFW2_9GAMM|nr:pseudouridine-5'-phosphate glycosidase [Legionella jordanis]KTD19038.1 indigoidine synthase A-like protein involved in pigment biosynthesis [Legionella jordanis]RMX05403.1 pseudouridine-5'-phosphate glycosidase [Legionella jordanis]RMX19086.1 pseudouridine-5'-phosphate glycosidase [Legionella jordanis]VEH13141.1 indigoidine synthase A-like protein involved in pigment biosynthesis [Legionella jordanis]HAT8714800.1 pseudouridine-5-phosphate glycosidase [Legionella jordanis]
MRQDLLNYNAEVRKAIDHGRPLLALESTIISHGMPYPDNLKTAKMVEQIIRDKGVTPATIALHQGKIHIGIDDEIMKHLATSKDIIKASRRDLAYVLSRELSASTTVAATMYCAHLAGLPLFATGGIGGVHQRVEESFDISADLIELASTPITVVCSGAKSILDLPKTLEMLETHGVPVIGYRSDEFPAFYSHSSGIPLLHRLDEAHEIAKLMAYQRQLKLHNGIVIANPIPKEAEIPHEKILPAINQAQAEANRIQGKAITPFLLQRIAELTAGQSLKANMELIKNNARLGAEIALAYQKFKTPSKN